MKALFAAIAVACTLCHSASVFGETPALDETILRSLRVVEDPDGHSNARSGPSLQSKVTGTVLSGSVVALGEMKGDWARLMDDGRYLHSSRLRKLDQWKQTAAAAAAESKAGVVKHAGFEAKVTAAAFVAADHKIAKDKEGATLVDGIRIWGTDGGVPRRRLSLAVAFDGKPMRIPADAMHDLFEPNMDFLVLLTPAKPAGQAVVLMVNSDGAGAYCVAWAFAGGSYRGRAVFGLG